LEGPSWNIFLKATRVAFFTFNPESQNNMASNAIEGASRPDVDIDALPCKVTFIKIINILLTY
jgi:hypothetical protein